jgi:hypothetical protein
MTTAKNLVLSPTDIESQNQLKHHQAISKKIIKKNYNTAREGISLCAKGEQALKIGLVKDFKKSDNISNDILITITGKENNYGVIINAVAAPIFTIDRIVPENTNDSTAKRLVITRQIGQSFIIRKKIRVSDKEAIEDLETNGISIYNLSCPKNRDGSVITIEANIIWDIIRIELTTYRYPK